MQRSLGREHRTFVKQLLLRCSALASLQVGWSSCRSQDEDFQKVQDLCFLAALIPAQDTWLRATRGWWKFHAALEPVPDVLRVHVSYHNVH